MKVIKAMRDSDESNGDELMGFHWQVYGYENKYSKEEFIERIAGNKDINWILDATKIRLRMKPFLIDDNLNKIEHT